MVGERCDGWSGCTGGDDFVYLLQARLGSGWTAGRHCSCDKFLHEVGIADKLVLRVRRYSLFLLLLALRLVPYSARV